MEVIVRSREDAEKLLAAGKVDALVSIHTPANSIFSHYHPALGRPCAGFSEFKGPKISFEFDDITTPRDGYVMPNTGHIEKLVNWGRRLPEGATVLIHCTQGASRSPAMAFTLLTSRLGPGSEQACLDAVVAGSFAIRPNMAVIRAADDYLFRRGALVALWEAWDQERAGRVVLA